MEDLSFYVGVVGNVISVLVFLSPIETFWRVVRNRSTEEFKSFPYICTLLGSSLWTYYGIVTPGEYLVATVNGFGALVEALYVVLFLIFSPRNQKMNTGLLVGVLNVGFPATAILATRFAFNDKTTQSHAMGFVCAGLNIIMYGSPLAAMKQVVTTRSVEYMPFLLSFFLFLNGAVWGFYASLHHDVFLLVPNGIGFFLGTAQLILYAIFRDAKPKPCKKINYNGKLEEGLSQHEPLISSPN